MDPQYEQRLRDEVIYLHSLWHQGPQRTTTARLLQPSNTTNFKERKPKHQRAKKSTNNPNIPPDSPGKDWVCTSNPPTESPSTWATSVAQPVLLPRFPASEKSPNFAANQAQQKALKTVRDFFVIDDAEDGSDSIDSSGNEGDEFMEEDDGRQEYTFFLKLFMEDSELKEYFEKNFAKGEFACSVCGALGGKNSGKKFKGCLSLVQHSVTIAKTKKKRAHRAYGQAVCKVLGWDIDRLPTIFSLLSEHASEARTTFKSDNKEGDGNSVEIGPENSTVDCEIFTNTNEEILHSSMAAAANYTGEAIVLVQSCNDSPTSMSNSLMTCETLKDPAIVQPTIAEETLPEAFPNQHSLLNAGVNPLEDLSTAHSPVMREITAEELTSGPLNEKGGVGTGIQIPGLQD